MSEAFWIALGCLAYGFMGGIVGQLVLGRLRRQDCNPRLAFGDKPAPFFSSVGWPLVLPVLAGAWIGGWLIDGDARAKRREKQKQADHERKMAELAVQERMTMESVKFLVENGIQADVPGLYGAEGK